MPELEDQLPEAIRTRLRFPSRTAAIREAHFPSSGTPIRILNDFRSAAQFRLIFEEFFWLECGLEMKRQRARALPGIGFALTDQVREQIKKLLPFKPTNAQKRVLKEIAEDMSRPSPMSRLLQGDVGSGKTIVAAEAAVIALENGYQVAHSRAYRDPRGPALLLAAAAAAEGRLRDRTAHGIVDRARKSKSSKKCFGAG